MSPQPCSVDLRPARHDEIKTLIAAESATTGTPWSERQLTDAFSAGYPCFVAVGESGMVGYVLLMDNGEALEILNLVVFKPMQRRGVGTWMLRKVCDDHPGRDLWLEVRADNQPARRLYRRFGFEEIGIRRTYYSPRDGSRDRVDAIMMRLVRGDL